MMEIIAVLNRRYAGVIELEGVFWEQTVYPAHATFQAQIDEPSSCDLVVCILWSRLGSPLPVDWPTRPDGGEPYESGTVYEFETALAARRRREVPDIYVFRKLLPDDRAALDQLMERHPAEKLRILDYLIRRGDAEARRAIELLESFWARWFYSPDKGFIAAFNTFTTADHFTELGRQAIEDWLIGKGLVARQPDWDIDQLGSPYPGLAAFDGAHAAVFFGRARVTERAVALFRGAGEAGFPWLLVTGPSGGGKSSLLRAGVVPALTEETVLETWRVATVRPGAEDPLAVLLAAIAGPEVLGPDLAEGDYPTAADLARIARLAPAELARPLLRALDRRGETVRQRIGRNTAPFARLLLVIDQLEELLLAPPERQEEFAAVLTALLAGGDSRIWVAASLRSDLQEAFLKIAAFQPLLTLDRGGRELKLAAPGPADMREVIEGPAARAGLSFETREEDGKSLADELAAAVGAAADALPLLQMTLALLFERRDPDHKLLRWADYTAMGGLEGAIASQAERVLSGLPEAVGAELGPLLRQLTRLWLSLDGEIELRPADLDESSLSGTRAELARALVAGRLVVADQGKLRIVHEAVLRNWDRARELLAADLDLARLKARLEPLAADWAAAGRNPNDAARLIPAGAQLAAADAAARRYGAGELGEELYAFVAASVAFERRQRTRRQRILAAIAAGFAGLAVLAIAGGIFAWHERGVATAALGEAEANYRLALNQAAGSVSEITDSYAAGRISTPLMQTLIERAQKTLQGLPGERAEVTAARVRLLDVLSLADLTLGQVKAARGFAEQAIALIDALPQTALPERQWRELWAKSRHQLGEVLFWQGDLAGALSQLEAARKAAAELVAAAPDDRKLVKALLSDIARSADTLRAEGKLDAAIDKYREWLAEVQKRRRQADDADWAYSEADVRQRLGDAYLVKGDPAQAIEQYSTYGAIAAQLAARDPADRRYQRSIAWSHERIGDALLAQNKLDQAAAEYDTYRDLTHALSDEDPTNFLWRQDYEVAFQRVGEVLLRRDDPAGALKQFEIYRAMTAAAKDKDPTNGTASYDLSNALQKIGDAQRQAGNYGAALDAYRDSLALAEDLLARDGSNTAWQLIVAVGHQRLAVTFAANGDAAGAAKEYRACLDTPISGVPYSPRILWPSDVHQYCRRELDRAPGDNKR